MQHARRGVALQVALRWVLVGFVALTVIAVPPPRFVGVCAAIAGGYALWALAVALWTRQGHPSAVRMAWLALLVDVVVLGVLTLLTGVATPQSWTSDVFTTGFLLIPVLAATQLRVWVCTAVVVPTAVVYFLAAVATREANVEPWTSLLLRTLVIVGVALGCVGPLADPALAGAHDRPAGAGPLRRCSPSSPGWRNASGARCRSTCTTARCSTCWPPASTWTTPARPATRPRSTGWSRPWPSRRGCCARPSPSCTRRCSPAPGCPRRCATSRRRPRRGAASPSPSTPRAGPRGNARTADPLLYRTAAELLNNVVKHAQAASAAVTLELADGTARLVVADDGVGMPENAAGGALRRGHIGLASHTLRIDAAGGRFTSAAEPPHGTVVTVELPVGRSGDTAVVPHIDRQADGVDGRADGIVGASGRKHPP